MAGDGYLGAAGAGAASGAGMGATLGSLVPGPGTAIGTAAGALIGGIGGALKQKKANESNEIPEVDPMERERLARIQQISKNLSAGTDGLTQQNISQQKNVGRAAQNAISKVTGGDVGGTLDALLRTQRGTQSGVNQAVAQAAQRMPYFDSAAGSLASRIAQRRLELGLLNRSQYTAENAQARTDSNVNSQALLATQGGTETIPQGAATTMDMVAQMIKRSQENRNAASQNSVQPSTPVGSTPVASPMGSGGGVGDRVTGMSISPQGFVDLNVQQNPMAIAASTMPLYLNR